MEKQSFADLGVSNTVAAALARRGIHEPFPVQRLVLADVLAGHDVLVKSPTGSGKTLAFGVPLAERIGAGAHVPAHPAALVLAPTRELASQIVEELGDIVRALQPAYHGRLRWRGPRQAGGPGRASRTSWSPHPVAWRTCCSAAPSRSTAIRILVLDEADRMLDMGFRPAIDRIVAACPAERQTLFFSATLDGVAGRVAARYTKRADHPRAGRAGPVRDGRHRAPLRRDPRERPPADAGGRARLRARPRAGVRAHQAGR